jgi:hypothetical protein
MEREHLSFWDLEQIWHHIFEHSILMTTEDELAIFISVVIDGKLIFTGDDLLKVFETKFLYSPGPMFYKEPGRYYPLGSMRNNQKKIIRDLVSYQGGQ